MQDARSRENESTFAKTLRQLMESRRAQMILAIILLLIAVRLYLPASTPAPEADLVSGEGGSTANPGSYQDVLDYQRALEKQLAETLQKISGAGQVTVMLTISSLNDVHIAQNTQQTTRSTEEKDPSGTTKVTSEQTHSAQPVMARVGSSSEGVVKLKESLPEINGVVVVATGASSPHVKSSLTQAVQTILSLPAHRVTVFPGK